MTTTSCSTCHQSFETVLTCFPTICMCLQKQHNRLIRFLDWILVGSLQTRSSTIFHLCLRCLLKFADVLKFSWENKISHVFVVQEAQTIRYHKPESQLKIWAVANKVRDPQSTFQQFVINNNVLQSTVSK